MRETTLAVSPEGFGITADTTGQNFEGHAMRKLEGAWNTKADFVPGGKVWEIRTDQPLGRLAFYLLEPTSDDGVVAWNYLDDQLKDGRKTYPLWRRR